MNSFIFQCREILNAIGFAIIYNIGIGIIFLLLIKFSFSCFPQLRPAIKYKLAYGTMIVMLFSFLFSIVTSFNVNVGNGEMFSEINPVFIVHAANPSDVNFLITAYQVYLPFVAVFYLVCFCLLVLKFNLQWWSLKKLRQNNIMPESDVQSLFLNLKNRLSISRNVMLRLSQKVNTPLMFGFLKPVILLPASLLTYLDYRQLEAVLLHELAHVRRNDYLFNMLQHLMETILFFNPAMWMVSAIVRKEREYACDDMVLEFYEEPKVYANTLLVLSSYKLKIQNDTLSFATNNTSALFNRIKRITMKEKTIVNSTKPVVVLLSALLLSLSLVAVYGQKNNSKKEQQAVEQQTTTNPKERNGPATEETGTVKYSKHLGKNKSRNAESFPTGDTIFKKSETVFEIENAYADEIELELNESEFKHSLEALNRAIGILKETDWNVLEKELAGKLNKGMEDLTFVFSEDLRTAFKSAEKEILEAEKEILEAEKELLKAKSLIQNAKETEAARKRDVMYFQYRVMNDSIKKVNIKQREGAAERRKGVQFKRNQYEGNRKEIIAKRAEIERERKTLQEKRNRQMQELNEIRKIRVNELQESRFKQMQEVREKRKKQQQELQEIKLKYSNLGKVDKDKIENFLINEGLIRKGKGYSLHFKDGKLFINNQEQYDTISKRAEPLFAGVQYYHYITNKSSLSK